MSGQTPIILLISSVLALALNVVGGHITSILDLKVSVWIAIGCFVLLSVLSYSVPMLRRWLSAISQPLLRLRLAGWFVILGLLASSILLHPTSLTLAERSGVDTIIKGFALALLMGAVTCRMLRRVLKLRVIILGQNPSTMRSLADLLRSNRRFIVEVAPPLMFQLPLVGYDLIILDSIDVTQYPLGEVLQENLRSLVSGGVSLIALHDTIFPYRGNDQNLYLGTQPLLLPCAASDLKSRRARAETANQQHGCSGIAGRP